jgi:hypothetical protein
MQADSLADVEALVSYITPSERKPFAYEFDPPDGVPRRSASYREYPVRIRNARSLKYPPTLDEQGFALRQHRTRVVDFYDEAEVKSLYYAELKQLVKDATGASSVVVFDHTVRGNSESSRSGIRIQVNVWRPIRGPLQTMPLAVLDARSLGPGDVVACDLIYRDRVGEIYYVAHRPQHEWYYFPDMRREEALLLKCFDTDASVTRFGAHAAFQHPRTPANGPPRESIEARTLAFFAPPETQRSRRDASCVRLTPAKGHPASAV